jgi:hypothetical protein
MPDDIDPEVDIGSGEYTKETVKTFGERGVPVAEQTEEMTDLESLRKVVAEVDQPICTCGAPITESASVYRCCGCEVICCARCEVRWSRQSYCPGCAESEWAMNKRTFFALVFIANGRMGPDELITVETVDEDPVEITVDPAATAIQDNGYISADGSLSPAGKEALAVGKRLYSEDDDVETVLTRQRIEEVANRQ